MKTYFACNKNSLSEADEVSVKHWLIDQGTFRESIAEVWQDEM